MLINSTSGSIYFTIFYSLAFFLAFLMLLWEGYKRKIPVIPWMLLLILSRVSFIAGTKIFTYSQQDWLFMLKNLTLIPTSEKVLLGGIILAYIALLIGKYILRIKQSIADAFAIVLPLGIGIQRIGCFYYGCCFGKPANLPWSVQYPVNTLPHYFQYQSGLIGNNDLLSLHINPVQLYEAAGAILVAFIVYKTRKFWKVNGSLFIFSLLSYSIIRFFTEFFRDNLAHAAGGNRIGIFNQVQWILLVTIAVFSFILLYREKKIALHIHPVRHYATVGIKSCLLIFIAEALLIWTLRLWFTSSELIAVLFIFAATSILFFLWILKEFVSSRAKLIYAGLLLLPLLITSQTIQPNKYDSASVIKTRKISFGISTGTFQNSVRQITQTTESGCNTPVNQFQTEYFKQKYTVGGASITFNDEHPAKKISLNYGVNLYFGQNNEIQKSNNSEFKTTLYGINPFFKIDVKWFGIGGGFHAGNIVYPKYDGSIQLDSTTAMTSSSVLPQAYFRLGPKKILFIDYHLADQFPSPFPFLSQQLGIGTGLGLGNGTNLRIGGFIEPAMGTYLSAYLPISKSLSFEPMLVFSNESVSHFSFGLHYNFSSKTVNRKIR